MDTARAAVREGNEERERPENEAAPTGEAGYDVSRDDRGVRTIRPSHRVWRSYLDEHRAVR